ncbi:MAG: dihydroxy-acid dehydratase [Anaerolineae bacterium]|nr:dihydroxy-acid dehydratase [Anaerolineae bacterium]
MAVVIERGSNPYRDNVQGKANEPITVAGLLDQAQASLGLEAIGHTLGAIYDRLEANAPRIAIIGGSPDHPAHILDRGTVLRAAVSIWERGGVPFHFAIPVVCDATAQSNVGMGYSLQSRNAAAEIVVNQMEAHSYHGAFVCSGCDKTPLGITAGLAHLDRIRQRRGDAPLFATFSPSHVLRGGTIPPDLRADLEGVARRAEGAGHPEIAFDIREAGKYILQCISNSAFQGVLTRARQEGLLSAGKHKDYERRLAVHTCHPDGGICAFNGTGNSSRHAVSGLGLTHPAVELLTAPPSAAAVDQVVGALMGYANDPSYSMSSIVRRNFANAVRIHSATGGSTNLMMHLVAAMLYAGYAVDVWTIDRIRRHPPVPDLFDYSLSEGRDIYALAEQCCAGQVRGMETVFYELLRQGIPMDADAPTVTGTTWGERLADERGLPAAGVRENPILLSTPRRPRSGIEVLQSNIFDTAVVKISGMTDDQLAQFDDQIDFVLFFENEEEANAGLLDVHVLERLSAHPAITRGKLLAMAAYNSGNRETLLGALRDMDRDALLARMVAEELLKVMVVISGQGPRAFGMPEMFTPMRHINANRSLHRIAALISDGRYSGTTWGAAIGHVTPEAMGGGWIGLLETGDVLHVQLTQRRIDLLDPQAFERGVRMPWSVDLGALRAEIGVQRGGRIAERRARIAATNRMTAVTDASRGVVPEVVASEATDAYPGQA